MLDAFRISEKITQKGKKTLDFSVYAFVKTWKLKNNACAVNRKLDVSYSKSKETVSVGLDFLHTDGIHFIFQLIKSF